MIQTEKKDDSMTSYIYSDIVMFALQAPWSLTFWLVYERIRSVTGMAGFQKIIQVELFYCGGFFKGFTMIKALQEWVLDQEKMLMYSQGIYLDNIIGQINIAKLIDK